MAGRTPKRNYLYPTCVENKGTKLNSKLPRWQAGPQVAGRTRTRNYLSSKCIEKQKNKAKQ